MQYMTKYTVSELSGYRCRTCSQNKYTLKPDLAWSGLVPFVFLMFKELSLEKYI